MRKIEISAKATKFLDKLKEKPLKDKFYKMMNKIRENPEIGKGKTGDLQGIFCVDIYHARVNYELAYKVIERDGELVIIILAGARGNFYDELKRYLRELDLE